MSKPTIEQLQSTLQHIDILAAEQLSNIEAIAKLALLALESPDAYSDPELFAKAFKGIWHEASDLANSIGVEAERAQCAQRDSYTDTASPRRWNASKTHIEKVRGL